MESKRPADLSQGDRREMNLKLDETFAIRQLPDGHTNQAKQLRAVRQFGREFAGVIADNTPRCADQTTAIRKVREAVLWASEAILREGLV